MINPNIVVVVGVVAESEAVLLEAVVVELKVVLARVGIELKTRNRIEIQPQRYKTNQANKHRFVKFFDV